MNIEASGRHILSPTNKKEYPLVIDNFFPEGIHYEIWNRLIEPGWSLNGGIPDNPFWHYDRLQEQEYFRDFLYEKICERLGKKFSGIKRIYANGQTSGQCGNPHYDDGDLTFLYYPNLEWDIKWQGHLIFLENMEPSQVISYKPNRAVIFPGDMWHYADAPSRVYNGLRISLAYKLWK
tara:strand:+ start:110 stop:643 length:534 start_codon:yes stop_codon:yes gene_type:complete